MKKCSKCKEIKPLTDFALNKAKIDGRDYNCLICHRKYTAQHYKNNKKYYKQKTYSRRNILARWLREYKSKLKCEQCDEDHPACLDFHHKDRKTKESSLYNAARRGWSIKRLLKEIAKCKILCCKCHRILHYEERLARPTD